MYNAIFDSLRVTEIVEIFELVKLYITICIHIYKNTIINVIILDEYLRIRSTDL